MALRQLRVAAGRRRVPARPKNREGQARQRRPIGRTSQLTHAVSSQRRSARTTRYRGASAWRPRREESRSDAEGLRFAGSSDYDEALAARQVAGWFTLEFKAGRPVDHVEETSRSNSFQFGAIASSSFPDPPRMEVRGVVDDTNRAVWLLPRLQRLVRTHLHGLIAVRLDAKINGLRERAVTRLMRGEGVRTPTKSVSRTVSPNSQFQPHATSTTSP
jgi:hypothetical protein